MIRREFIKQLGYTAGVLSLSGMTTSLFPPSVSQATAQAGKNTFSRDLKVDFAVNQVGYLPDASKVCVIPSTESNNFQVRSLNKGSIVFSGDLTEKKCDFGSFAIGDFSTVREPGMYIVEAGDHRSHPFEIRQTVYEPVMREIVNYFSKQRCGPSTTGFLAPCHLDDGVRKDTGKHQNVTGGWHDASDLRKWVDATLYGIIGLGYLSETLNPSWANGQVMEELRWGNRYFLNMQEPQGYVMSFIGGGVLEHGDNNRWTDNIIGSNDGKLKTVEPGDGESKDPMTVYGSRDDRVIETDPLGITGQYNFIATQALMARLTKRQDPDYSAECLNAARKCIEWCETQKTDSSTGNLGYYLNAILEMYRATGDSSYLNQAINSANSIVKLQVGSLENSSSKAGGYFLNSTEDHSPHKDIWRGYPHILGLCQLIELADDHQNIAVWKTTIRRFVEDYLIPLAQNNSYGIVPFGLFAEQNPGGDRKFGNLWYRYFMIPDGWWVGINSNLASAGIALIHAARVLEKPSYLIAAQRQLDWILGLNPFLASTVEGFGHNQPEAYINSNEFRPATPIIPGAVMNGIGGNTDDEPSLYPGSYHTAEYWTPMVAHTLWLAAELQRGL